MKFTAYEAEGIRPPVENSPLMGWMYRDLSLQAVSNLLGVVEIAITLPDDRLGFRKGVLLRDPDGHALQVIER